MAQAGLLSGSFRLGAWDEASRDAYTQLLGFANAKGLDAENALGLWASGVNVETDADGNIINEQGPVREPLVTQTTDPESLRRLFRSTVVEQLGEGWDTEKINLAVKTYNALEEQRQREMYDAQLTGGNVVSIPDPASYIAEQAIKENPEGHETEQALGFMDEFMSMAQGNGWS
jgi:hypothetical protein